jgi:putative aminopeptidase FrvX
MIHVKLNSQEWLLLRKLIELDARPSMTEEVRELIRREAERRGITQSRTQYETAMTG